MDIVIGDGCNGCFFSSLSCYNRYRYRILNCGYTVFKGSVFLNIIGSCRKICNLFTGLCCAVFANSNSYRYRIPILLVGLGACLICINPKGISSG